MQIVEGNAVTELLEGRVDALLHVVNAKGRMGSGIAKEIRQRIPAAYQDYRLAYVFGNLVLGKCVCSCSGPVVYNMCAQENYGYDGKKYLSDVALRSCLQEVAKSLEDYEDLVTIAVPYKMGSDRAGGDWKIVSQMIKDELEDKGFTVVAFKLK